MPKKSIVCPFTGRRIVAFTATGVTTREYGRTRNEARIWRAVSPTGAVTLFDRVTGESVGSDVASDSERKAGY
jgi:hypothetical protein